MEKRFNSVSLHECKVLDKQGVMITPNPCEIGGFNGDAQQWLDCGKVIIGWEKDNPPGPGNFIKPSGQFISDGYKVTDVAGRTWTIPIARSPSGRETLPTEYGWDLEGNPTPRRRSDCNWMWELSGEIWDYWNTATKAAELGGQKWLAVTALRILQINYDIGPIELEAFCHVGGAVVDDIRAATISMCFIDHDLSNFIKDAKKNEKATEAA